MIRKILNQLLFCAGIACAGMMMTSCQGLIEPASTRSVIQWSNTGNLKISLQAPTTSLQVGLSLQNNVKAAPPISGAALLVRFLVA